MRWTRGNAILRHRLGHTVMMALACVTTVAGVVHSQTSARTATSATRLASAGVRLAHEIDSAATAFMKSSGVIGMALVVVAPGPDSALVTTTYNYGTVSKRGAPVTASTLFEIGSETKVFTGTLLAMFVREGRVALSDPMQKYLPATVRAPTFAGKAITMLDLATHRSALPRMPANIGTGPLGRSRYTTEQLFAFLSTYTLPRAPGAEYEYSNLGFGLLGTLLARVANGTYEGLVVDRITTPLGMPDTRIVLSNAQRTRLATGYTAKGAAAPEWQNSGPIAGGGGLLSTTTDLAKFLAANIDPARSPMGPAIEEAQTLHPYQSQPQRVTGLGWERIAAGPALRFPILTKNGGTAGFTSWMGIVRARRVGLAVLTNNAGSAPGGFTTDLLRLLARRADQ
jgi:CubicO group peptidase (beta-lactamase class C family)